MPRLIRGVMSSWESHTSRQCSTCSILAGMLIWRRVFVLLMQTVFFPMGLHKVSPSFSAERLQTSYVRSTLPKNISQKSPGHHSNGKLPASWRTPRTASGRGRGTSREMKRPPDPRTPCRSFRSTHPAPSPTRRSGILQRRQIMEKAEKSLARCAIDTLAA
jgi:hypothetical protein